MALKKEELSQSCIYYCSEGTHTVWLTTMMPLNTTVV